jgi:hypothetical protein
MYSTVIIILYDIMAVKHVNVAAFDITADFKGESRLTDLRVI